MYYNVKCFLYNQKKAVFNLETIYYLFNLCFAKDYTNIEYVICITLNYIAANVFTFLILCTI